MTKQAYSPVIKAAALAVGLGIGLVSHPVFAAPASGGETVQGLHDALLNTMKNARALGQSGRFTQMALVVRQLRHCLDGAIVGRSVMVQSDRCAAPADDRKLRSIHLGNLCRPL